MYMYVSALISAGLYVEIKGYYMYAAHVTKICI